MIETICTHCGRHPGRHPLLTADGVERLCPWCVMRFVAAVEAAGTRLVMSVTAAEVVAE